jgi:hypothetical protein
MYRVFVRGKPLSLLLFIAAFVISRSANILRSTGQFLFAKGRPDMHSSAHRTFVGVQDCM